MKKRRYKLLADCPYGSSALNRASQRLNASGKLSLVSTDQAGEGETLCVVTSHNYGRFLNQCLNSLVNQSVPFAQIVVVDDASTDSTKSVVGEYESAGVVYLRTEFKNACKARNAGVAHFKKLFRFLIFVDADNYLAADYHEKLRGPMADPTVGATYGVLAAFNHSDGRSLHELAKPFDYHALRQQNYVDTCALVRAEAFRMVGGWPPREGFQDWALWLKITQMRWKLCLVPETRFHYRRHENSMTLGLSRKGGNQERYLEVLPHSTKVSIVTLFSGRTWMLKRYAKMLAQLKFPKGSLAIVAVDNSRSLAFHKQLTETLASTGIKFIIERCDREAVPEHKACLVADSALLRVRNSFAINEHLAHMYSLAAGLMPANTDYVFSLEDDIEPDSDCLEHFLRGFATHTNAGVFCGAVQNRFGAEQRLIAWTGLWTDDPQEDERGHLVVPPPRGTFPQITGSGFMCTIFRRPIWDKLIFRASPHWNTQRAYYDWAAAYEVGRMGSEWRIAGSVRCKHWQADGTYLAVYDSENRAKVTSR